MKNLFFSLPLFHYHLFSYEILRSAQNDIFAPRLTSTKPHDYRAISFISKIALRQNGGGLFSFLCGKLRSQLTLVFFSKHLFNYFKAFFF